MFDPLSSRRRRTQRCTRQDWLSGWRGVVISIAAKADREAYEGSLAIGLWRNRGGAADLVNQERGLRRRQCHAQAEALITPDNPGLIWWR
jgi:hypothetical protein